MSAGIDYDTLLARILAEPSVAATLLDEMADALTREPYLRVDESTLSQAERYAYATLRERHPETVVEEAANHATQHIPPPHWQETGDTYALRLRDIARGL